MESSNHDGEPSEPADTTDFDFDFDFDFASTVDVPYPSHQETQSQESFTQPIPDGSQDNPTIIMDNSSIPSSFTKKMSKARKPRSRGVEWSSEMTTVLLRELVYTI